MPKPFIFPAVVLLILAVFSIFIFKSTSTSTQNPTSITQTPSQNIPPQTQATPTPTEQTSAPPSFSPSTQITSPQTNQSSPGGSPAGQIICKYDIPSTPDQFGSAKIDSSWNNLLIGKNGTAKVEICVGPQGSSKLMVADSNKSGSREDIAPWIALNASYNFNLYDTKGGESGDCSGVLLSSCNITTSAPTPSPTPTK